MQSSGTKTKRTRKTVEETNVASAPVAAAVSEEPTKTRRQAAPRKPLTETTPAVKHRGAARKTAASQPPESAVAAAGANDHFTVAVSRDQIAVLAYSYWESRGFQGGSPEEDWFRAERELGSR
jgi:Protein of unknown function (DUF2934)